MNNAFELAKEDLGTWEWADGHNPKVVQYFADVGHSWVKDDETAWCAAFVGAMLERSGYESTRELTARSYLTWGEPVDPKDAKPGDILVFKRGNSTWQGHVGFLVQDSGINYQVLGGNQSNQVNIKHYSKKKLLGIRRPVGGWEANAGGVVRVRPKSKAEGAKVPWWKWLFGGTSGNSKRRHDR